MRIAAGFINPESANAYYRMIAPLRELARRGHTILLPGEYEREAPRADLVYMQQFFTPGDLALVRRFRERGIAVVWDTDDDISAIPKSSPAYAKHGGRRGIGGRRGLLRSFERTVEMARAASLMTTPSAHLAELYGSRGVEHVRVLDNRLSARDAVAARRRHAGVVIGCVLAQEHLPDIRQLRIGELLQELLDANDGVRVVAYGVDLGLSGPRYRRSRGIDFDRLLAAESEFDIGLAPLADSAFSRARSDVKLKEYATAGAMWLASPVGPYRGMGEEQGGLLVADGAWRETIERLLRDRDERLRLTERARAWAARQTVERAGGAWETAFQEAVRRSSARPARRDLPSAAATRSGGRAGRRRAQG